MPLEISTSAEGGRIVLVLAGDIDLNTVDELDRELAGMDRRRPVVVDLSAVQVIDSWGLRAFVLAIAQGLQVTLRAPSPVVTSLLEVTGLAAMLPVESAGGSRSR